MDKFHLINVFVAVVETNGFNGAARKLNLSAPAVTRAINELEAQLGMRLLTRTTRTLRVTEAGDRYVQDCRRILTEIQEADESVAGMHSSPRGRLNITAPVLFGTKHVTPIVTDYLSLYSEVSASCIFLDRIVNLIEEGVDVAIRIGQLPDSSMQAIRVGQVRRVVCGSVNYFEKHGEPQSPEDLKAHTIVSSNTVTPYPEWHFLADGAPYSLRMDPRLVVTTNQSAIATISRGFGVTTLLSYQVEDQVKAGQLKIVLEKYETAPLPVHIVHREGKYGSRRVRSFLDLAIQHLRSNPALCYQSYNH